MDGEGNTNNYLYAGRLFARSSSEGDIFYHQDGLGSVSVITDVYGQVLNRYTYDVFGDPRSMTESVDNIFRFTGEIQDPNGLLYLRARYYDPSIGRFLSQDTFMGQLNDPLSQNLYVYTANNPVMYVDPTGHFGIFSSNRYLTARDVNPNLLALNAVEQGGGGGISDTPYTLGTTVALPRTSTGSTISTGAGATTLTRVLSPIVLLLSLSGSEAEGIKEEERATEGTGEVKSPSNLQRQVEKGQAPKDVDRVDKPHVPGQKPHVHFKDGTSLNNDGTVHDAHRGTPNPSNKVIEWLEKNGWKVGD